jgi:hypothetical protein
MRGDAGTPELIVFAPLDREPRLAWRFSLNLGFTHSFPTLHTAVKSSVVTSLVATCREPFFSTVGATVFASIQGSY